jgi:hypothetical protein
MGISMDALDIDTGVTMEDLLVEYFANQAGDKPVTNIPSWFMASASCACCLMTRTVKCLYTQAWTEAQWILLMPEHRPNPSGVDPHYLTHSFTQT